MLFTIDIQFLYIDIPRGPIICYHLYHLAITQFQFHSLYTGRTYAINITARSYRIKAHTGKDIPSRHLTTVIISTQRTRLVTIKMTGNGTYPFLAFPWLPQLVVQEGDMMARFIAMSICPNTTLYIVRTRNILIHLNSEQFIQTFQ